MVLLSGLWRGSPHPNFNVDFFVALCCLVSPCQFLSTLNAGGAGVAEERQIVCEGKVLLN